MARFDTPNNATYREYLSDYLSTTHGQLANLIAIPLTAISLIALIITSPFPFLIAVAVILILAAMLTVLVVPIVGTTLVLGIVMVMYLL